MTKLACRRALKYYAIAYQIADDINDIDQDQNIKGKQMRLNAVTIFETGMLHKMQFTDPMKD